MGTKIVQGDWSKQFIRELVLADMIAGREILIHKDAGFTEFKPIAEIVEELLELYLIRDNTTIVIKSDNVNIERLVPVLPPVTSKGVTLIIQMVPCGNASEFNNLSAEHYLAESGQLSMITPYAYKGSDAILSDIMNMLKAREGNDEDN